MVHDDAVARANRLCSALTWRAFRVCDLTVTGRLSSLCCNLLTTCKAGVCKC